MLLSDCFSFDAIKRNEPNEGNEPSKETNLKQIKPIRRFVKVEKTANANANVSM